MSVDLPNQSLNVSGGLPPLPTTSTITTTTTTTGNTADDSTWPGKKKNNKLKYLLGGLLAIVLVGGTAFGAYYFTRNLNQASVPTAPESEPMAAGQRWQRNSDGVLVDTDIARKNTDGSYSLTQEGVNLGVRINDKGVVIRGSEDDSGGGGAAVSSTCTASDATNLKVESISTNSAKLTWTPGVGSHVKLWVSSATGSPTADCGRLPNKTVDSVCVANENGSLDANHADIPSTTTSWIVNNLKPDTNYNWRLMMWVSSGCDNASPVVTFKTLATCVETTWTPDSSLTCTGANVTQTSNCGTTRTTLGTKTGGTCCTSTSWSPGVETVCLNTSFVQTDNCSATRSATGTKTGDTCTTCTNETWSPAASTVCDDEEVTQTSSCSPTKTRVVDGTKECTTSDGNLSVVKRAYEDEEANSEGDYELNYEMSSVAKNQIFVYAFEITNEDDAKIEDIKVVDTLKGDNTDLLTYVDGDDRCTYTSSTRKVTCDGMDLLAGDSDTYAFRVKVSSNAINGDTIMNAGEITYKNMVDGGEMDASSELTISTVVGCNHVCTSDDECSSGLTCDTDTNKCRKPSCSEASSCNCPVERTTSSEPTRRATVARAEPTELVEAGILDFPGVATFGGGLLLAIIGILLAL